MDRVFAEDIKRRAQELGADLCGIAAVERFSDAPRGFHPTDVLPGCKSVIVIAVQFPVTTLATPTAAYTFVRNRLVDKVDAIAFQLALELERLGCRALPIPSSDPYDFWDASRRHGQGILSLKHAAVLAGLGRMGKNTLLVNRQYGNMLWLGAVVVDRELASDPLVPEQYCPDECSICLDACPAQALTGESIIQSRCRDTSAKHTEGGGGVYVCKLCRTVCPNCTEILGKTDNR